MIQPISQNISRYPIFKNLEQKDDYNLFGAKAARSINSDLDFQRKVVEQNERMIKIAGISAILLITAAYLPSLKILLELSNNRKHKMPALIRDFKSLANDDKVMTTGNCKSVNKNLKSILERQINYAKAGSDVISQSGKPQANNRLLLYGSAGVGKSYFAKVFAKSLDAEYMEVMYSDFNSMWAGEGVDNLKKVFENILKTAKKNPNKKYVVTFNEIDAIVQPVEKYTTTTKGTHWVSILKERSVFLNYMEILKEKAPNVTVIGTTNISPKNRGLDGAAMSRFQNIVEVPYPDKDCLYEALKMNLESIKDKDRFIADNEKELKDLAKKMADRKFSFRNLEYVLNDAKQYQLDDQVNGNHTDFKMDYIKKAEQNLKFSDGELD